MDKKTFGIGVLAITALILLIANLLPQQAAMGGFAISDSRAEYQLIIAHGNAGSDDVYIINRDGKMILFQWDNKNRVLVPSAAKDITTFFGGVAGGGGGK
ncbi:MAG TPA: hypothetical protein VIL86_01735 [Tepidisphaeraceae bacterium]